MNPSSSSVVSNACQWCGQWHMMNGRCPDVKAFEYHPDGSLKRVEFKTPADCAAPNYGNSDPIYKQPPFNPNRFRQATY